MLFKIQNLGAVKEAEIDLSKDLILLCGHNNTGKTYVAYAMYRFIQFLADWISGGGESTDETLPKFFSKRKKQYKINLKDFFDKIDKDILFNILKGDLNNIDKLKYFWSVSQENQLFNNIKFDFSISNDDVYANIFAKSIIQEKVDIGNAFVVILIKEENTYDISLFIKVLDVKEFKNDLTEREYTSFLHSLIEEVILNLISNKPYIFPAERSATNIFSTELSLIQHRIWIAALKDNPLIELAKRRVNRYPQPIRDSLELSQDLETLAKTTSPFSYLADELEQAILKGKISVGQYGDLRYSPAESPDLKLEMHVSSSLVKSLASISFYLRHIAQKGDCIIIDEPELNLHPDNQILVARFLARLVNEGFKVIASTHSDYIIREINNLIMLGKEDEKAVALRKKYEYSEKEVLKSEQVQALLFKRKKGEEKVVAENLTVSETGLAIETIDEVIEDLENRTEDIYFNLFEQ
ncbi:MAG: AAA family ATPase [Thermoflexibacter sp.]|nr:AAA family ATPase [Thermoflexibacter sp.]